jgi:transcriptional regulator with XRE-family HTH domain
MADAPGGAPSEQGTELDPTMRRSRLSAELRAARLAAGFTQRQAARDLRWSVSKLMRIEAGQVGVSATDARALLARYGVTDDDQVTHVVALAQHSRRHVMGEYRDVLHPEYLLYLGFENAASQLRQFEPLVVPGLLQTPSYAEAIIRAVALPDIPDAVSTRQVAARLARQALLGRDNPPRMSFVIDEAALRRWVGSKPGQADILREQLDHLDELARQPNVTIQVLSFRHGFHYGMMGAFVVLDFDTDDEQLLYLETGRPNLLVRDKPDLVAQYDKLFEDLQAVASSPDELTSVLDSIRAELPD